MGFFYILTTQDVDLGFIKITFNSWAPNKQTWFLTFSSTSNKHKKTNLKWNESLREMLLTIFSFHFSRKIKESLECFPVKLNNLIHTLAQMTAISPAKSASQTFPQESCLPNATRSIQRATILGFSKKTSNVSLNSVILT